VLLHRPTVLSQALDCSTGVIFDSSFGSISGIATKHGLGGSEGLLAHGSTKEIGSSMLQEICDEEEDWQGLSHQRNQEAREVRQRRCETAV
jgi:hypothetical protein